MVMQATTLGRNGVQEFILVRISALILAVYVIYLLLFFSRCDSLNYQSWLLFWGSTTTQVLTLMSLLGFFCHAWIGLWQVLTDYVKPAMLRGLLQLLLNLTILMLIGVCVVTLWRL